MSNTDEESHIQVIPILPNGRYAIVLDEDVEDEVVDRFMNELRAWQESDEQFMVLSGSLKLVRVDE